MVELPTTWLPKSIDISQIPTKDVVSHLDIEDSNVNECSIDNENSNSKYSYTLRKVVIGSMPQFQAEDAVQVVTEARKSWNKGVWKKFSTEQRIEAIRRFIEKIREQRDELSEILQWEIAKNTKDANAEVDRTIQFVEQVLELVATDPEFTGSWKHVGSYNVFVKRAALGVVLALAPYNYPLNECYAAVLPALIMGNVVVLKIPTTGGLVHLKTFQALAETLPEGTIHFISGSGRVTMPPVMQTGEIDALAFIGGSNAADKLIHDHPHPHRLKSFLQLEAKNIGLVLPDIHDDQLDASLQQIVSGALSYNGQRCTAIKLILVPVQYGKKIVRKLKEKIDNLNVGLPWETHSENSKLSDITPLPFMGRVEYMNELIQDAIDKGAELVTGGYMKGGVDSTLMAPALVYPVQPNMRLYKEEQFGPIVVVGEYTSLEEVLEYTGKSDSAQQVAIFGSDEPTVEKLITEWSSVYGKINWNVAPGRSPDIVPFSGRKSSALGVMSVRDAALEFSVPTVVSTGLKQNVSGIVGSPFFSTPTPDGELIA